ncbi:MAG TPA: four helix bundle protein [Bacteroidia bacterium]|nr:four helix bundle protein [Bacteroidia bacterium]
MATYNRFEDLPVWQHAREMAKGIFVLIHATAIERNFKLKDQMFGSSGSIMDNVAEGFERGGNKEFVQFLFYAKGSAGELRSQLYRSFDYGYLSEKQFAETREKVERISAEIQNFTEYLAKSVDPGYKYRNR